MLFQSRYHVPRSFLKPTGNLLVIFEEETGNPVGITLDVVSITKTCGQVSESHYPLVASWMGEKNQSASSRRPKVRLSCPTNKNISSILFASFGTPSGDCQSYATGTCHSPSSRAVAEQVSFVPFLIKTSWDKATKCRVSCPSLLEASIVCADRQAIDTVFEHRYRSPKGQEIANHESDKFSGNRY